MGSWGGWGGCSRSCGGGQKTRTYSITTSAQHGGQACPYTNGQVQSTSCNTHGCPVNCVGGWTKWSYCSAIYGNGEKFRQYVVSTPNQHGGAACPHSNFHVATASCKGGSWATGFGHRIANIKRRKENAGRAHLYHIAKRAAIAKQ